ncbi:MAG TPA: sucrase ferredoxin [Flexivirga sp.]|uniref:sucrase ferredoxin n=1 Tax=Flexivirga sp. TaxID=1962927 RepID=UPI002CB89131|nr:sucrase ferredoxin [Flexivirga sp.]HWC23533.1 sucrase ferredoxin [Flexivirga sp.]
MTRPGQFRCAAAAFARGDRQAGTAARARGWVLIEHPGPWPFGGFAELDLAPEVQHVVRHAAQSAGMRILLVRRHGRQPSGREALWAVLRYDATGEHRQEWGSWSEEADLAQIAAAIDRPGATGLPPVHLVCTHGVHDACCAIRGRPVARALNEEWPDETWECSHVGGDRYAANVLVAPDGVYFGDVTPDQAIEAVGLLRSGLVAADHLRGYTDLAPAEQYAVAEVLGRFGPAGRHAIQVRSATRRGDRWTVLLECAAPLPAEVAVELRFYAEPAAQLTCLAPAPSRALAYETVAVRVPPDTRR